MPGCMTYTSSISTRWFNSLPSGVSLSAMKSAADTQFADIFSGETPCSMRYFLADNALASPSISSFGLGVGVLVRPRTVISAAFCASARMDTSSRLGLKTVLRFSNCTVTVVELGDPNP